MLRIVLATVVLAAFGLPNPATILAALAIDPTTMLAVGAAFFGPLITYIIAARRFSGKIETTEAKRLWEESRDIRRDLADRLRTVNGLVARLEDRNETLEHRVEELERENIDLRRRLDGMV